MTERIIPIADARYHAAVPPVPDAPAAPVGHLEDARGRRLHDLRISVTDRCNFRCTYCMPKAVFDKDYRFLPQSSLLSFEEITRLVRIFIDHGVEKIRLTGGEPLLRKDLHRLIAMLSPLRTARGAPLDLTLTTNGSLLTRKAQALRDAGLQRVTVSLDALDDRAFRAMNDVDFPVSDVLAGIEAADRAGLAPLKINMVVKRGVNDHEIVPMVRHFRGTGHIVRFIEFMDVGASNGWRLDDVVPSADVIERIRAVFPLDPIDPNYPGEVAERWRLRDGSAEIGVISSVTQPFCGSCTRARLSTEGRLYTCLFATGGHDLRALLRGGCDDAAISGALAALWQARSDRYSEIRASNTTDLRRIEMSYIGG
ncbi:MAG TPA: GTP 3',8-cyclase MoaA [Quisquiliibacterium sp.]|nr:GTP 3',8-cyclase MoaA [Quisquiliibacterium sp.]HQN12086.1 GTP 3',8-cyclase MoaA [Quisquiliibacterium sp.]